MSVFIPTYNRARLLGFAIESVLAQTYGDFRLVDLRQRVDRRDARRRRAFDDPRIEYVRQPENLGMLGNHNWFLRRPNASTR